VTITEAHKEGTSGDWVRRVPQGGNRNWQLAGEGIRSNSEKVDTDRMKRNSRQDMKERGEITPEREENTQDGIKW
jgi:hypothetical protein